MLPLPAGSVAGEGDPQKPLVAPAITSFGIRCDDDEATLDCAADSTPDYDCPSGDPLRNDNQVDVGTSMVYCVFARVLDNDGSAFANIDYLDIQMFYDQGETASYNSSVGANRNIHLNWTNLSGTGSQTFTLRWPRGGEVTLLGGVEQTITNNEHEIRFRLRFAKAVRWAPCGAGIGGVCPNGGAADANSWNGTALVRNAAGQTASAVMEFGTYKRSEIAVTGNPAGSGIPGGPEFVLTQQNPQSVSFSTNAPYRINASICDLASGPNLLARQYLQIDGDPKLDLQFKTPFVTQAGCPAPSTADIVLNGTATCFNEFRNGTGTTGASLTWYARVPLGTLAGTYTSAITFRPILSSSPNPCAANSYDAPDFLTQPLVTDLSATSFRVSWVPSRPVTGRVQISLTSGFTGTVCTFADAAPLLGTGGVLVTVTSSIPCPIVGGTTVYWRVTMTDASGRARSWPLGPPYPSNVTKTDTSIGSGNPTFIIRPYSDRDGSTTCNLPDDRQPWFLAYLNHSSAGTLAARGAGANSGCGQGVKAGWLVNVDSDNLRDSDATGAPHPIGCGESVTFWVVGQNNSLLFTNTSSYTRSGGDCGGEPVVGRDARTATAASGPPVFLFGPLATDLSGTGWKTSWVPDRAVYGSVLVSTSSSFASVLCAQMDLSPMLTSGGVIASTSPACSLSTGTQYWWRAYMMDSVGRAATSATFTNTTKTNTDPPTNSNPTFNVGPYGDVDGNGACNSPDDRQQYFLLYLNHTGAERMASRGAGSNSGCGQGAKSGWIASIPSINLRNSDATGAEHDICAETVTRWTVGRNSSLLHSGTAASYTWSDCLTNPVDSLQRTGPPTTGGPAFVVAPVLSDLRTTSFALSWVASKAVAGTVQVSTDSFATILCVQPDAATYLASGAVLSTTSPGCALSSGTAYQYRGYMRDAEGRVATSSSASLTTKTDATPGSGNPTSNGLPYRDFDLSSTCGVVDQRQAYFVGYVNHSGAGTLAARGAGVNFGCGQENLAGWIISFDLNNLRDTAAAGAPHALAASETFSIDALGMNNGTLRKGTTVVTWDGSEDPVDRFVSTTPTGTPSRPPGESAAPGTGVVVDAPDPSAGALATPGPVVTSLPPDIERRRARLD